MVLDRLLAFRVLPRRIDPQPAVTASVVVPLGSVQTFAKMVWEIAAFIQAPSQSRAQASRNCSWRSPSNGKSGLSELFLAS